MQEYSQPTSPAAPVGQPDQSRWAMLCHAASLAGFAIPFGNILGPLLVWILKKDEMPLVDDQGKEAMNFQITMTLLYLCSFLLVILMVGILFLVIAGLLSVIFTVVAMVKASEGVAYRYPFALRLVK